MPFDPDTSIEMANKSSGTMARPLACQTLQVGYPPGGTTAEGGRLVAPSEPERVDQRMLQHVLQQVAPRLRS